MFLPVLVALCGFYSIARWQNGSKAGKNWRKSELRMAQRGVVVAGGQQPERSNLGAGGLLARLALCVISLWKFRIKKAIYKIAIYLTA